MELTGTTRARAESLRRRLEDRIEDLSERVGTGVGAVAEVALRTARRAGRLLDDTGEDLEGVLRELRGLEESTAARGRAVRDVLRAAPRFTRLVSELGLVVAAYRLHAATRGPGRELVGEEATRAARERLHRECASRVHDLCVDLRGGVLKLGQLASARVDLLPPPWLRALGRLQDRVPPVASSEIEAELEQELGPERHALLGELGIRPLAAASLAQVHPARLTDGTRVAVKVLVPGIEEVVETDVAALRVIAPALRDLLPGIDLATLARELGRALRDELDLETEARSARRFAREAREDAGIRVPQVYPLLSTRRVLVLERIEGVRLVEFLDRCEAGGEAGARARDRVLSCLARSFTAQILERGFFHADPHPGNFLVVETPEGPEVAVLDFGCVQEWAPPRRRAYAALALAALARDPVRLAEGLRQLGFQPRGGQDDALERFAAELVAALGVDILPPSREAAMERLQDVVGCLQGSPIVQVPEDCILVGRVLASLGGLFARYRPRVDLLSIVGPALIRAASSPPEADGPALSAAPGR